MSGLYMINWDHSNVPDVIHILHLFMKGLNHKVSRDLQNLITNGLKRFPRPWSAFWIIKDSFLSQMVEFCMSQGTDLRNPELDSKDMPRAWSAFWIIMDGFLRQFYKFYSNHRFFERNFKKKLHKFVSI